ncbi:hypothetical protein MYX65_01645 [Acidobacteria bacterium AH-259-L09]|nr:hypothetical protein [Acidobacteria bacterium AH-259-L09]
MLEVIELLIEGVVRVLCIYTGEIVLFIVTFGRHSPRWKLAEDSSGWTVLKELSFWVGVAFWIGIGFLLHRFLVA